MNYLVYVAYGRNAIWCEAFLSVISYLALLPKGENSVFEETNILIYTNAPAQFREVLGEQTLIIYPAVSAATWKEWHGTVNKVYMLKINALQHAVIHYQGQLLFVDTDTLWLQLPDTLWAQIAAGKQVLHDQEGELAGNNILNNKVYQHLKNQIFKTNTTTVQLYADTIMYNSGAIGFRSKNGTFLEDVRQLAEQFFTAYDKHIMEQLAFSVLIPQNGPVVYAAPYVLHYWNLKAMRPTLELFFAHHAGKSIQEIYVHAQRLDIPGMHEDELAYRSLPSWRRSWRKILGKQWQMPELKIED